MVVVDLDDIEPLETIAEEPITNLCIPNTPQENNTLFDMDEASYPSSLGDSEPENTYEPTIRIDLDESVSCGTSSSEETGVMEHDLQEGIVQQNKHISDRQQDEQRFDLDEASYPSSVGRDNDPSNTVASKTGVDLGSSVFMNTSSSEENGVMEHDLQEGIVQQNKHISDRQQDEQRFDLDEASYPSSVGRDNDPSNKVASKTRVDLDTSVFINTSSSEETGVQVKHDLQTSVTHLNKLSPREKQQEGGKRFDKDEISYPNGSPNAFVLTRVDLDESVVGSTSSSDDADVEVVKQTLQVGATPQKTPSSRKQRQREEERLQASHSKRLICIAVTFVIFVGVFATFLQFWLRNRSKTAAKSSPTVTRNASFCQLCQDGFELSSPLLTIDLPTSASSVKGLTCGQVWENAHNGEYDTTLLCELVKSEAAAICTCSEAQPVTSVDVDSKVSEPTASPVSAFPTTSPTMESLYVPPNPVPQNRARSYFNYDMTDNQFGPRGWPRINMSGTYYREFGEDGFGAWDGHLQHHVADSTLNRCGHSGKQSPVNLIRTTWGESECTAAHQIRTRAGSLTLADETIQKQIEPNKLRIVLNRRRCLDLDNKNCHPRPPIADFPNYSSTVTHHSDLMHLDIKVPGEHQIDGETFDAEIQMMHIHLDDSRIAYVGVSIRATEDGYNEKYQVLLDQFQRVYNEHKAECAMKQRRSLRFPKSKNDMKQSTYSDDPDLQRRLQQQGRVPFDPHGDFLETVFFYRYNGSSPDPPCFPVTWFFLNKPIHIDHHQLRQTKELLFTHVNGNCEKTSVHNEDQSVVRPIQPLGVVHGTDERRFIMSCMDGDFPPDR